MKKTTITSFDEHTIRELEQLKMILAKITDQLFTKVFPSQDNMLPKKSPPVKIKSKNKIVSFRIPQLLLDSLELQVQKQNKNVNLLVREILHKYIEWDKIYSKFNTIIIPRAVFDLSISNNNDAKINEIVDELKHLFLDLVLMKHGSTEFDVIMSSIENFLKDINIEFEHILVERQHHLSILCAPDTIFGKLLQRLLDGVLSKFINEYNIEFLAAKNIFRITWTDKSQHDN